MNRKSRHTIHAIGCLIVLMFSSLIVNAQELQQGSFEPLLPCRVATVQFDFSKTTVEGLPLSDYIANQSFIEGEDYNQYFSKAQQEVTGDFIEEFNDTDCPILLTISKSPSPIIMVVKVHEINRKGNQLNCSYEFYKQDDSIVLCVIEMTSKDGRVGSFTNLMGDAFEKAGKDLGKYMKKQLKQANKKRR